MKRSLRPLVCALLAFCLAAQPSFAEVGNDNPTGVTGDYNGSITTAGSYDPYTGNGKRFITDLTVTGSVGAYPLKWTRILNTRGGSGGHLGHGGTWRHSYQWGMWIRPPRDYQYHDNQYEGPSGMVSYPDGRTLVIYDWYSYMQPSGREPGDSLVEAGDGNYDLIMQDGGVVKFRHPAGSTRGDDLVATEIVDPYGQTTFLGRDAADRLSTITEPAGRYLQITYYTESYDYAPPNRPVQRRNYDLIDYVDAYDGRGNLMERVDYTYETKTVNQMRFYNLIHANYADNAQALYKYYPVTGHSDGMSMLAGRIEWCKDVRYDGAMSWIKYEYASSADNGEPFVVGQLKWEKNLTTGQTVSEVIYPPQNEWSNEPPEFVRTEKRGDGPKRVFQYANDGTADLKSYTDFRPQTEINTETRIDYGPPGATYLKTITDARGKPTTSEKSSVTGAVIAVNYPDGTSIRFVYSDMTAPYHMTERRDENGHTTYFDREPAPSNRISQKRYPDGGIEQFTYDNRTGQVETHTMTNGGVENFRYDARGLKTLYWPPPTCDSIVCSDPDPWNHPTRYFYYDGSEDGGQRPDRIDRLKAVTDPRGRTTTYDYNKRGQVTRVTHPATAAHGVTYTESAYYPLPSGTPIGPAGSLAWTEDELRHRTSYEYDEYKRVTKVTNPLTKATTNDYAPWNGAGPLSHTTSSVYRTRLHSQKVTEYDYDENFRRKRTTVAPETNDAATTTSTYDPVGNLETVTDPNHQADGLYTLYGYDDRNRQTSVTDVLGQATTTTYDPAGNKSSIMRADGHSIQFPKYDEMNRLEEQIDERQFVSSNSYDLAGNLKSHTDERLQVYTYDYDLLNRKVRATYPPNTEGAQHTELWQYDFAGNLANYTNRSRAVQTFTYDERNRPTHFTWSDGTSWQGTAYDGASRVRQITNAFSTINQTYHDDNRLWTEEESTNASVFGGSPPRTVTYTYDDDGNRKTVAYPGSEVFTYDYTPRNQLWTIKLGQSTIVTYEYDPSGNMKKVTRNENRGTETQFAPDEVNRVRHIVHYFVSGGARSFEYAYNRVNNVTAVRRDWGAGDGFEYDQTRQITGFNRDGTFAAWPPPPAGNPANNPVNSMSIGFDAGGNRTTVTNSNTALANISYVPNDLNQYVMVNESGGAAPTPTPPPPSPTPPPTPTAPPVTPTPTPPVPTPTVPPVSPTPTPTPLPQVAEPTFDPETRSYPSGNTQMIKMTSAGATIYYTTNGDDPSLSAQQIASGGSVPVSPTYDGTPLRAIARKAGMSDSNIHEATYFNTNATPPPSSPTPTATATATATPTATPTATATAPPSATPTATPQQRVATPTFNPPGGSNSTNPRKVTISTTTPNAYIIYTTDDTTPTSSNGTSVPSGAMVNVRTTLEGTTLQAIACRSEWSDSLVQQGTYFLSGGNFAPGAPVTVAPGVGAPVNALAASANTNSAPDYDDNGNLTYYKDWIYTYDAQNRLRSASNGATTATFYYDGKNRQIARRINEEIRFSVWDGWELIEEYGSVRAVAYLQGATGVLKSWTHNTALYYYQDKLGSTTHIADASGTLLESYRYDLYGTPSYFDSTSQPLNSSTYGVVDLYAGERWIPDLGLYDLRNRFMSPELGRFLQPDPIGLQMAGAKPSAQAAAFFWASGAPTVFGSTELNLYRYCHNDPVNKTDPMGLEGDVVIYREHGRASTNNQAVIFENGRSVASFRANENGFIRLDSGPTRGPRSGEYALLPKINAKPGDSFPNGQPSVTARQYADPTKTNYAPGRAGPDYKADGTVRVHNKSSDGQPDSTACVTASGPAVDRVTKLMNDNTNTGGTRIILIDGKQTLNGHDVRRAEPVVPRRYGQ